MKKELHFLKAKSYFDELSELWNAKYRPGTGTMTHRIPLFKNAVLSVLKKNHATILDFGCGGGAITQSLREVGFKTVGCDISFEMLRRAKSSSEEKGLWVSVGSLAAGFFPFQDHSFDAVISSSVFEYIEEPKKYLGEFSRILKPDGHLFFTVPNPSSVIRRIERGLAAGVRWLRLESLPLLPKKWIHYFEYLLLSNTRYELDRWQNLLKETGFIPVMRHPSGSSLVLIRGDL